MNAQTRTTLSIAVILAWTSCAYADPVSSPSSRTQARDVPTDLASQAESHIRNGQVAAGLKVLQLALDLRGAVDGTPTTRLLTNAARAHGDTQVERLVADRKVLSAHVKRGGRLWKWASRKFAGEDVGQRVYWDGTPPGGGSTAEHGPVDFGSRGWIRVDTHDRRSETPQTLGFEATWAAVVFELYNIAQSRDYFYQMAELAASKSIPKEEFVRRAFAMEFVAVQQTQCYYVNEFLPWAAKRRIRTDPRQWYIAAEYWRTAEECLETVYADRSEYPWTHYGDYYDELQNTRESTMWDSVTQLLEDVRAGVAGINKQAGDMLDASRKQAITVKRQETVSSGCAKKARSRRVARSRANFGR